MKIIKKVDWSNWRHRFTCAKCESELEADADDVMTQFHEGYCDMREPESGKSYYTYYLTCAVCYAKHEIPDPNKEIPAIMRVALQGRKNGNNPQR